MRRVFTREELEKVFRLNKAGELERLNGKYKEGTWTVVECVANRTDGYCHVQFKGSMILYHTIIWILTNGPIADENTELDHIDGNRINNRIENLRLVCKRENQQNRYKHRAGRLVGCRLNKRWNKWQAQIVINGKQISLGYFNTEAEAHQIYCEALTILDKSVEEIQEYFGVAQFSSEYKGVSYNKQCSKWVAYIQINGRLIYLGLFDTELEANTIHLKACDLIDQYIDNAQFRALVKQP